MKQKAPIIQTIPNYSLEHQSPNEKLYYKMEEYLIYNESILRDGTIFGGPIIKFALIDRESGQARR